MIGGALLLLLPHFSPDCLHVAYLVDTTRAASHDERSYIHTIQHGTFPQPNLRRDVCRVTRRERLLRIEMYMFESIHV